MAIMNIYICCINVRYCLTIRKIIKLWSRINICNILCTVFSDNNTPINAQTGLTNRLANNTNNTRLERTGRRVRRVTSAQLLKKHCLSCCLHDKACKHYPVSSSPPRVCTQSRHGRKYFVLCLNYLVLQCHASSNYLWSEV